MASITDELRHFANEWDWLDYKADESTRRLRAIADRIDEAHKSALASAYGEGAESVALPDLTDYIKLPLDADGEVWHVGDFAVGEVNPKNPKVIERMIWYGPDSGWQLETDTIIYPCPDRPRHHHEPTVEDVLDEMLQRFAEDSYEGGLTDFIASYATKLQLKED